MADIPVEEADRGLINQAACRPAVQEPPPPEPDPESRKKTAPRDDKPDRHVFGRRH